MTDLYKVLGIDRNASGTEVKLAFRKLALKFHPDRHPNSSEQHRDASNRRFKELVEAYEVLSDEKKRRVYNKSGRAGLKYGTHEAHRRAGGDAAKATYAQGPYQGGFHSRGRRTSPFDFVWRFSFGFGRADYIFHGLIFTMAIIGFTAGGPAADALWRAHNSGKSFDETIESVERRKQEQTMRDEKESSPTPKENESANRT